MTDKVRIIIAGPRDWDRRDAVTSNIASFAWNAGAGIDDIVVIHGSKESGVDEIVRTAAEMYNFETEEYTNAQDMATGGADVCLVFSLASSNHPDEIEVMEQCEIAGIPVEIALEI